MEGQVWAAKTVVVGENAEIDATIEADVLEIHGTVIGDIHVRRQTTLHKSARVEGEIQTAGIVVEEGARFKGCIVIGPDDLPSLERTRAEANSSVTKPPAPALESETGQA